MTEIIKARSDAELLALVPRLAGYTAKQSIVCVAFVGRHAGSAFRLDLPARRRLADYRAVSSHIIGTLKRMRGVTGVALVIYTDSTFAREAGVPWLDLERHVTDKLNAQGFVIKNAFCVASDGWASYFDRDYPRQGRPLSEIEPSVPVEELGALGRLPEVTAAEQYEFLEAIVGVCAGYWPEDCAHLELATPIEQVEAIVHWQGDLPSALGVELIELAQSPARRDVISLQIAFGDLVAEAIEEENSRFAQLQIDGGGTMDEIIRREIAAGRMNPDDEFMLLLMGKGRLRPDWERTERMIGVLSRFIALSPTHYRPGPLCILAYLLWARGLSSVAATHVDTALNIDPDYGMAQLLNTMLSNGMLPEWVYG